MAKKPKRGKPKLTNCSPQDVFRALKKLGGFEVDERGAKHNSILHLKTGMKSTIPRANPINRYLLKDFVEDYLIAKLGYSENEIYRYLWC